MPTLVVSDPQLDESISPDPDTKQELGAWLYQEIEDAIASRRALEERWRDDLRRYEAVPRNPARHRPVEGRMEIEVPLGAIAVDAVYAQELSLVFNTSPLVTARATNERFVEYEKALQRFINFVVAQEDTNLRPAVEESLLDKDKMGTGIYYTPWTETWRRTRTSRMLRFGPCVKSVAPEDFLVPGDATDDLQRARWCAMWLWLSQTELDEQASNAGWDIEGANPAHQISTVRRQRELLGSIRGDVSRTGKFYEIVMVWCSYDINNDGICEDLLVAFDRTSRGVLYVDYNPYDRRPFRAMRFMRRGHMFYGIGIMDMTRANQEIGTDIMNYWLTNAYLANVRMWISSPDAGMGRTIHAWPGRNFQSANPDGIKPLSIADVYPSMPALFQTNMFLTERRTGVNQLTQSPVAALGNRTPGITALTAMQSQNQRFTAAFDSARTGTAGAVKDTIFRYQERLLMEPFGEADGDLSVTPVSDFIREIMGPEEGELVIAALSDPRFDDGVTVEMTASDASINREADRQNALLLANLLGQYYVRTVELVNLASNPQIPQAVKDVAIRVSEAAGEVIERTIRTFDQVRDPEAFIVDIRESLAAQDQNTSQQVIGQLLQAVGGLQGQNGQIAPEEAPFPGVV